MDSNEVLVISVVLVCTSCKVIPMALDTLLTISSNEAVVLMAVSILTMSSVLFTLSETACAMDSNEALDSVDRVDRESVCVLVSAVDTAELMAVAMDSVDSVELEEDLKSEAAVSSVLFMDSDTTCTICLNESSDCVCTVFREEVRDSLTLFATASAITLESVSVDADIFVCSSCNALETASVTVFMYSSEADTSVVLVFSISKTA